MIRLGRVIHCALCRMKGNNRDNYPNKSKGYVKQVKHKRCRKRKGYKGRRVGG